MTVKLVVLYPHPLDVEQFEQDYNQHHLVLMRELVGPDVPLPTYKVISPKEGSSPYYRVAEIHFNDRARLQEFATSEKAQIGKASSEKVSTGGKPILLICDEQAPV